MATSTPLGEIAERVVQLVRERDLGSDMAIADELGALVAEAHSIGLMGLRASIRAIEGARSAAEASARKLLAAEHEQRAAELGWRLLGRDGSTAAGAAAAWVQAVLYSRCLTIAGGTSEMQRNVIAERLLGLPRDP